MGGLDCGGARADARRPPLARGSGERGRRRRHDHRAALVTWRRTRVLGARGEDARRARRAQDPALDADISQVDNEAFTEFSQVAPILEDALANRVVMRGEIVARRTARVTIAFVVVVGVIVGAYFALRQPLAVASAVFPGEGSFGAEKAVDRDPATELAAPRCHAGVARRAAVAAAFDPPRAPDQRPQPYLQRPRGTRVPDRGVCRHSPDRLLGARAVRRHRSVPAPRRGGPFGGERRPRAGGGDEVVQASAPRSPRSRRNSAPDARAESPRRPRKARHPFNASASSLRYEYSMGQSDDGLPPFILRVVGVVARSRRDRAALIAAASRTEPVTTSDGARHHRRIAVAIATAHIVPQHTTRSQGTVRGW